MTTDRATGKRKSVQELRRFGFVMAAALAILGAFLTWRGRGAGSYFLVVSGGILGLGLVFPRLLGPVELVWMALARVLSAVATMVILVVAFLGVITPIGLIIRLLSRDGMGLRPDRGAHTYWVPVDPAGPTSRPDKPF